MPALTVEETQRLGDLCKAALTAIQGELGRLQDARLRSELMLPGVVIGGRMPFSKKLTQSDLKRIQGDIVFLSGKVQDAARALGVGAQAGVQ